MDLPGTPNQPHHPPVDQMSALSQQIHRLHQQIAQTGPRLLTPLSQQVRNYHQLMTQASRMPQGSQHQLQPHYIAAVQQITGFVDGLLKDCKTIQQYFSLFNTVSITQLCQHPVYQQALNGLTVLSQQIQAILLEPAILQQPYDVLDGQQGSTRRQQLQQFVAWAEARLQLAKLTVQANSGQSLSPGQLQIREQAIQVLNRFGFNSADEATITDSERLRRMQEQQAAVSVMPSSALQNSFGFMPVDNVEEVTADEDPEESFLTKLHDVHGFTVDRELGRGGMGVVSLATDSMKRTVVLKRMQAGLGSQGLDRFEREAQTVANLTRRIDGLVEQFHFFECDGEYVLSMEYISGPEEYRVFSETIALVLFESDDGVRLGRLKKAVEEVTAFAKGRQEQINTSLVHELWEFFASRDFISDRDRHTLARLRAALHPSRDGSRPLSLAEFRQNPDILKGLRLMQQLIDRPGLVVQDDEETARERKKAFRDPRASLQDYLDLDTLHEKTIDGVHAKLIFKLLREVCGDAFPEAEMLQMWGYIRLAKAKILQQLEEADVLHRDLKPANMLFKPDAADAIFYVADQMMNIMLREEDPATRSKKLKEMALQGADMMARINLPIVIIDFGLVNESSQTDLKEAVELSRDQGSDAQQGAGNAQLTLHGTVLGTVGYMTPRRASPPEGSDTNDPRADYHAESLTIWEMFLGETLAPLGSHNVHSQFANLCRLPLSADKARRRNPKRAAEQSGKGGVPLAMIDMNPDLVEVLEEHHPFLLDYERRSTYLSEDLESFPDLDRQELIDYLEGWLRPKGRTPLWRKVIYAVGGAGITAAVLLGIRGVVKSHQMEQEAQRLEAQIDRDLVEFDLLDSNYTSAYWAQRLEDCRRIREIYGDDITADLDRKLTIAEKKMEFYRRAGEFREAFAPYARLQTEARQHPEQQIVYRRCTDMALDILRYLQEQRFRYSAQLRHQNTIPEQYIVPSTRAREHVLYAGGLASRPHPEKYQLMCEYWRRVHRASRNLPFDNRLEHLEQETEYRAAKWVILNLSRDVFINPTAIEQLSPVLRQQLFLGLLEALDYMKSIYDVIPDSQHDGLREKVLSCIVFGVDVLVGFLESAPDSHLFAPILE